MLLMASTTAFSLAWWMKSLRTTRETVRPSSGSTMGRIHVYWLYIMSFICVSGITVIPPLSFTI